MKRTDITLLDDEYSHLQKFIKTGKKTGKELERAYVLLALNDKRPYSDIENYYHVNRSTIWRIAECYKKEGLDNALKDKPRTGQPKKYMERHEAEIISLACSDSPKGRKRWTIRLLTEHLRKIEGLENVNRETVRLTLKKNKYKPWLKKMWCIAKLTKEYRRRMYKLLDLYNLPHNPLRPVVCMDEKSKQLISDTRQPIRMSEGKVKKIDYEYKRNGTRNIFVAVEPKAGKHILKVTRTRTKIDFALFIWELVYDIYSQAEKIIVVLDNLNTHFAKSIYEAFSKQEADKLLGRVEFHYTPKHASWLNMAEIEISMLEEECIDRRIGTENLLIRETSEWLKQVNQEKRKINWQYTKRDAYKKLSKHYVS